ncbi:MAG: methyltransferase domain-containing protein [Cytophagales bacterium]|nr:MAG: methyltransferase domain-containing protein [Cytophagales bacterium]
MTPTEENVQTNEKEALQNYNYEIVGKPLQILSAPDVWAPYSAKEMMTFLIEYGYLEAIQGFTVLDLGTGSGIIGIMCGLLGAKQVTLTDYCHSAVNLALKNAHINGVAQAEAIDSDRFVALEGKTFDLIISNPPVQPWLFTDLEHTEARINSAAWNEAGADGRLVLDSLLKEGNLFLTEKGTMIFSCSTRHGHRYTTQLLDEHWTNNWQQIYAAEHTIDHSYHEPYIPTWLHLQTLDFDLRIYQKDLNGKHYAYYEQNQEKFYITTYFDTLAEEEVAVKMLINDDECYVLNQKGETLEILPITHEAIPKMNAEDNEWYYVYYLIRAVKNDNAEI